MLPVQDLKKLQYFMGDVGKIVRAIQKMRPKLTSGKIFSVKFRKLSKIGSNFLIEKFCF